MLNAWDMGIWNNEEDEGDVRAVVVHTSRTKAVKLMVKLARERGYTERRQFSIDDNPSSKDTPEYYNVPNKIGIYSIN